MRSRGAVRILAAAALTSAILLVAPHSWQPAALDGPVGEGGWTARTRAWFVASGFYPAEVDTATGHQFSWTEETFRITIPHLHRSRPHRLAIDVSAGRPSGEAPELLVTVDGVAGAPERVGNERRRLDIVIPSRTSEGVTVAFRVSSTFVPGPDDPRKLGLLVHAVGLSDSPGPSWAVIARTALAVALCVAGVLLCGLGSRALEWFVALGMAAAAAWLMLADGAFLGILANRLVPIGLGTFAVGVATALLRARWPVVLDLPEWSAAVGLVLSTSAVKLAFFAHPMITVGDGIFQVHRAQLVHQGHYFFTSVTPSPSFEIPYPVGLYVAALPFWDFFPSKLDLLRLLRTVAVVADALVGLGLYAVARRQWNDPRAALLAAGLWPFARAPVWGLCNANLTNVFGQALFGLGMGVLAWIAASPGIAIGAAIAGGALLVAAYLSHFGTVLVGVPLVCLVGGALLVAGRAHVRRAGLWILLIGFGALAASYVVYYSHFTETYQRTASRVVEERADGPTKLAAPPGIKLQRWLNETSDDYGLPGLPLFAAAAVGAWTLARRRPREGLSLFLGGWALAWMAFAVPRHPLSHPDQGEHGGSAVVHLPRRLRARQRRPAVVYGRRGCAGCRRRHLLERRRHLGEVCGTVVATHETSPRPRHPDRRAAVVVSSNPRPDAGRLLRNLDARAVRARTGRRDRRHAADPVGLRATWAAAGDRRS